ncbi:MAG: sulfatase [Gemmatimonadales bacterium]
MAVALALAWWSASAVVVPWLIGAIHAGRIPALGRLLAGRDRVPLETYLADWAGLVQDGWFALAALLLTIAVVRRTLRRPVGAAGSGAPTIGYRDAGLLAIWLGLLAGIGEALYLGAKLLYLHEPVPGYRPAGPNAIWMAPIGDVGYFLLAAGLLLPAAALVRGRRGPAAAARLLVGGLLALALLVLLSQSGTLWWWSAALIALGAAARLSALPALALPALRPALPGRIARLSLVRLALLVAVKGGDRLRELRLQPEAGAGATASNPNVLLRVLDTQRAASMGLYGYGRETTPRLAAVAAEAVVFDRAIAPAPWTLPSHATMFTGRYNWHLGTDYFTPLDERFETLAEALLARGYRTGGFVGNIGFGNRAHGLAQGFSRYRDEATSPGAIVMSAWLGRAALTSLRRRFGDNRDLRRRHGETINREFFAWLDEAEPAPAPFFAFLNFFDTHGPYRVPALPGPSFAEEGGRYWLRTGDAANYSATEVDQLRDAYDDAVRYQDAQIGALLDGLADRGLLDRTLVIVVGDHGEEFAEHGAMGHDNNLYLTSLRVPLVIRYPERVPGGVRVTAPVSPRDLPATVMDLAGLGGSGVFPGSSLARHWRDGPANGGPDPVFAGHRDEVSVVVGHYHLLRSGDAEELYDLSIDPGERANLAAERTTVAEALGSMLDRVQIDAPRGERAAAP